MDEHQLADVYRRYIDCLNAQDWDDLGRFVDDAVVRNDDKIGLSGYRAMLEADFRAIPDLRFEITLLICQPPLVASRLHFDCTPVGILFDLPVNGRRVAFDENVFYEFSDGRIRSVWSIIDRSAIAAQL